MDISTYRLTKDGDHTKGRNPHGSATDVDLRTSPKREVGNEMRIYVASSFKLLDRVKELVRLLEIEGHTITVKWWSREYNIPGEGKVITTELKRRYEELDPEDFYARPETSRSYYADFQGVKDAQAFIFVAADEPRAYNGANVELGIALGDHIPCFSIGALEKSVLYYTVTKCISTFELISCLRELGRTI